MSYSQNDPRWKNEKIGFDTGPNDTIGNYGCYMTAIANVCQWAGHDHTPDQINGLAKQDGWLVRMDEIGRDDIPSLLCNNLTFEGRTNWTDAVSMNFFADASSPDVAYIIKIDASHAPGVQSHFVMVWARDGDNDLMIDDSWDGARKPLSHYGNPAVIIYSAMKFVKQHDAPAPPPPPPVVQPVVPPPPVVIPPPYIPPAAPNPVKRAETYTLDVTLPFYASVTALQNTNAATGHFPKGTYYVWSKAGVNNSFYQLGTDNIHEPVGQWVNILNNKVPAVKPVVRQAVTVEPLPHMDTTDDIINSWQWGYKNHQPAEYKVLEDMYVYDQVHSGGKIPVKAGQNIDIYGSFVKNGTTYLRPLTSLDNKGLYYFYGIPTSNIPSGAPHLENEFNIADLAQAHWEAIYDKGYLSIDGVYRKVRSLFSKNKK